jgi:hypothetical protein
MRSYETIQRRRADHVDTTLASGGRPLDSATRSFMEPRFGYDFGSVQIHTDSRAAASAADLSARAYTVGNDIVFGDAAYQPGSSDGQRLIAHELAHVVQQSQGPVSGVPLAKGLFVSEPGDAYEREADAVADAVMSADATPAIELTPLPTVQRQVIQGFWDDDDDEGSWTDWVAETAGDAYDSASGAVGDAAEWVGDTASDAYDSAAGALGDAAEWVGETASDAYDSASGALGDAAEWVGETASDAYDSASGALGDAAEWVGERASDAYDWASENSGLVGTLLGGLGGYAVGGIPGAIIGALIGDTLGNDSRSLTEAEIAYARDIYRDSLDHSAITITRDSVGAIGASRTLGNTIHMGDDEFEGDSMTLSASGMETLIHELGHVWQYQHKGWGYAPEALWAQYTAWRDTGSRDAAYDWRKLDADGVPWEQWNPEAQAEAVHDYNGAYRAVEAGTATRQDYETLSRAQPYIDLMMGGPGPGDFPTPSTDTVPV